jgi:hypothetical protein
MEGHHRALVYHAADARCCAEQEDDGYYLGRHIAGGSWENTYECLGTEKVTNRQPTLVYPKIGPLDASR